MGTKNNTSSTNSYNPASLSNYQNLATSSGSQLSSQISSPTNNRVYNGQQGQLNSFLNAGAKAFSGTLSNQGGALGSNGRGVQPTFASNFNLSTAGIGRNSLLLGAAQNRQTALGAGMNFRPLQTGGTQTEQTTGTGTIVPVLTAAATAAASAYSAYSKQQDNNMTNSQMTQGSADSPAYGISGGGPGSGSYDVPQAPDSSMMGASDSGDAGGVNQFLMDANTNSEGQMGDFGLDPDSLEAPNEGW